LAAVFWGITALQVLVSINVSPPGATFDPESLIRFPLSFPRFLVVRLSLGLLSVSTVALTFALLGAASGITLARPSLAPAAFAAALLLAAVNVLFVRMVFAWVDRWVSTRRAREVLTGLFILVGLGFQYLNFNFNPGFNHGGSHRNKAKLDAARRVYHATEPVLHHLPPGLAARAILHADAGQYGFTTLLLLGLVAFAAVFLGVYASRMHREYRGENLSDSNAGRPSEPVFAVTAPVSKPLPPLQAGKKATPAVMQMAVPAPVQASAIEPPGSAARLDLAFLSRPILAANLRKEWIYVRRNTAQLYGLLAPIAMVFLVTMRFTGRNSHAWFTFPAAVAYSTLGVSALAYNSFGLDAAGVQFYFLAPVRLGSVLLVKNLFNFALNLAEIVIIFALISYTSGVPPWATVAATILWVIFASLVNVTLGNRRSITAPKKMDPAKLSRKQASQFSALLSLGVITVLALIGAGLLLLGNWIHKPWLPVPVLFLLAGGACFLYWSSLGTLDALALRNRETMIEELCKPSLSQ
jgi:ABC-2 type transport system permease protein